MTVSLALLALYTWHMLAYVVSALPASLAA
jgi:hypothetical protein